MVRAMNSPDDGLESLTFRAVAIHIVETKLLLTN